MRTVLLPVLVCVSGCIGMGGTTEPPESAEAELLELVEQARQAELALQAVDDFLPCSDQAAAEKAASVEARVWDGPDCWIRIGWKPETPIRGGYWVEVAEDKSDFTVHGVADVDGDGVFAHVTATKGEAAKRISAETAR